MKPRWETMDSSFVAHRGLFVSTGEAMHHSALREHLKKQPFQPFRMILSNGSQYEIRSPEWMLVTGMTTAIGVPGEAGDGELLRLIDNAHINELIPLTEAVLSKST